MRKIHKSYIEKPNAFDVEKFRNHRDECFQYMEEINSYIYIYKKLIRTDLDENRIKSIKEVIKRMRKYKRELFLDLFNKILCYQHLQLLKYDCDVIAKFSHEFFGVFPDMNLWLLNNNQPIGLCSLKAQDIFWAFDTKERGVLSARHIYLDIKVIYWQF